MYAQPIAKKSPTTRSIEELRDAQADLLAYPVPWTDSDGILGLWRVGFGILRFWGFRVFPALGFGVYGFRALGLPFGAANLTHRRARTGHPRPETFVDPKAPHQRFRA